jgi:hypothetical protein
MAASSLLLLRGAQAHTTAGRAVVVYECPSSKKPHFDRTEAASAAASLAVALAIDGSGASCAGPARKPWPECVTVSIVPAI